MKDVVEKKKIDETARVVLEDVLELVEKSVCREENELCEAALCAIRARPGRDAVAVELDHYFVHECAAASSSDADEDDDASQSSGSGCGGRIRPEEYVFGRWRAFSLANLRCDACKCKESLYWRRVARRLLVCNTCFFSKTYVTLFNDEAFKRSLAEYLADEASRCSNKRKRPTTTSKGNGKRLQLEVSSLTSSSTTSSTTGNARPLTRTALNGASSKNKPPQTSNTSSSSNNAGVVTLSTQLSSTSVKSESQAVATSPSCNNVPADEETKDLCSIENKPSQNVRKSARISQSKTKSKLKYSFLHFIINLVLFGLEVI